MTPTSHPIFIGCGGWSYEDWVGPFYPEKMKSGDFLEYYADRFPIVEVDSTFYRSPPPKMVRSWHDRTPADFKFVLKVPRSITHEKQLKDCRDEVKEFVSSILLLEEKLACALLQMGYFNRAAFGSLDNFLPVLDRFLADWPSEDVPLAVEVRNPRWVGGPLLDLLRGRAVSFVLTEQKWMPTPAEVVDRLDAITGPFGYVRLIGDREGIEKVTTRWDRTVLDRSTQLAETALVIKRMAQRVPVYAFSTNHFAGNSPETARELCRLLGQPERLPPERPRTTLFD